MKVEIFPSQTKDDHYVVNGKIVWQDMTGNWTSIVELEPLESRFFEEYIRTVRTVKRGLTAIYKI